MSVLEQKWIVDLDPQTGLFVFVVTGRCTSDERADIEANVTRRYEMVTLPNAGGAVLKSLDGSTPFLVEVEPPTMGGAVYTCVKVEGACTPFAPAQPVGSPYAGKTILSYRMRYLQVGGVA